MGLLGAMVGGGRALGQLADVQLVKNHEAEKDAARQAAELEKEKRIAEQNKQLKSEENQYKIDAETRAAERTKQERQDTFNFNTDPANAEKVAQSKLVTQAAEDKYGDSRFPTKLGQETQLFLAKQKPDSQEELDLKRAQAEYYRNKGLGSSLAEDGISAGVARQIKVIDDSIENINTTLTESADNLSDLDRGTLKRKMFVLQQQKEALIPNFKVSNNTEHDIAGIREEKQAEVKPNQEPVDSQLKIEVKSKIQPDIRSAYETLDANSKRIFDSLPTEERKIKFLVNNGLIDKSKLPKSDGILGQTRDVRAGAR